MDTNVAVIDALERAPTIVVPLVREVPPALLKRRPLPTKWSAHEHACHLAVVHGLFFARLDHMLHYSVFIMFRHLALHDFFHAYRIEELLLKKDWTPE
jgi:DinB superfamily